ncbi:ISL3 family transposase (plasmid) [Rhodococcus aetherivorans]|uniref:ISL3 family transposase n=1 Tax=Rhodococcus aetherivorans TaxID=191292 RepID=A0AA46Q041_9NOCA|nr:ISL3 family transposase [Rhodococcus aetherivorans]UYF97226.1 ISL3 family transposase [Rhodococcus aetherivorans]
MTIESIDESAAGIRIRACAAMQDASCPDCGNKSVRVRSRYDRTLADAAIGNRPSRLVLRVRRFLCPNGQCSRRTFAEQINGLTFAYARRTRSLTAIFERIGLALAGRAGARLADALGMPVGRSTLLRLVRSLPEPPVHPVEVLGIDDFALRKRHRYGTVLVDMNTHRPIDVLPDRRADTVAAWLAARPGTAVICRDRAGAYTEAARTGAPEAIEVADRWHLWHNLAATVEKTVAAHHHCLRSALEAQSSPDPTTCETQRKLAGEMLAARQASPHLTERTKRRFAQVAALKTKGLSIAAICRELGLARNTVRRFYRATEVDELLGSARAGRPRLLDGFTDYLHVRWGDGQTSAAVLYEELRAMGYRGSYTTVRSYVRLLRHAGAAPLRGSVPKVRQITSWMLRHPRDLTDEDRIGLKQVLAGCRHLEATAAHVTASAQILTERRGENLNTWMAAVRADDLPHLHRFVRGLDADHDAVRNGLTLPYSSGAVEGHVNRIKMLKRQMYGRAGFDLLRKRILLGY